MKFSKVIFLLAVIFVANGLCKAQSDSLSVVKIFVLDAGNKLIPDAKLEVFKIFTDKTQKFDPWAMGKREDGYFIHLGLEERGTFLIKVSAKGFDQKEFKVRFDKGQMQTLSIRLKRTGSDETESLMRISTLYGVIFDRTGVRIPNAKVVVTNQAGDRFEMNTEQNGYYSFNLPYIGHIWNPKTNRYESDQPDVARYDLRVNADGFREFELKDFVFANTSLGGINWNIVLDVGEPSPGGAIIRNDR